MDFTHLYYFTNQVNSFIIHVFHHNTFKMDQLTKHHISWPEAYEEGVFGEVPPKWTSWQNTTFPGQKLMKEVCLVKCLQNRAADKTHFLARTLQIGSLLNKCLQNGLADNRPHFLVKSLQRGSLLGKCLYNELADNMPSFLVKSLQRGSLLGKCLYNELADNMPHFLVKSLQRGCILVKCWDGSWWRKPIWLVKTDHLNNNTVSKCFIHFLATAHCFQMKLGWEFQATF